MVSVCLCLHAICIVPYPLSTPFISHRCEREKNGWNNCSAITTCWITNPNMQKYTRNVKFNIMLMKNQQSIPQLIGRHRVKVPIRIVNHSNFNSTHDIFRSEYEITEKKKKKPSCIRDICLNRGAHIQNVRYSRNIAKWLTFREWMYSVWTCCVVPYII